MGGSVSLREPPPLGAPGMQEALVAAKSRSSCTSPISSSNSGLLEGKEVAVKMPKLPKPLFVFLSKCRSSVNFGTRGKL